MYRQRERNLEVSPLRSPSCARFLFVMWLPASFGLCGCSHQHQMEPVVYQSGSRHESGSDLFAYHPDRGDRQGIYMDDGVFTFRREGQPEPELVMGRVGEASIALFSPLRQTGISVPMPPADTESSIIVRKCGGVLSVTLHPALGREEVLKQRDSIWLYLLCLSRFRLDLMEFDPITGKRRVHVCCGLCRDDAKMFDSETEWMQFLGSHGWLRDVESQPSQ